MNYLCNNCGRPIPEGGVFCSFCGAKQDNGNPSNVKSSTKKSLSKNTIILLVLLFVICVALIVMLVFFNPFKEDEKQKPNDKPVVETVTTSPSGNIQESEVIEVGESQGDNPIQTIETETGSVASIPENESFGDYFTRKSNIYIQKYYKSGNIDPKEKGYLLVTTGTYENACIGFYGPSSCYTLNIQGEASSDTGDKVTYTTIAQPYRIDSFRVSTNCNGITLKYNKEEVLQYVADMLPSLGFLDERFCNYDAAHQIAEIMYTYGTYQPESEKIFCSAFGANLVVEVANGNNIYLDISLNGTYYTDITGNITSAIPEF